ncbi:MAG: hypothetical protein ABJA74_16890, partial [Lapillicoccus sp.]
QRLLIQWIPEIVALRDRHLEVNLVELGAGLAAATGDASLAARLAGCADGLRDAVPMRRTVQDDRLLSRFLAPALSATDPSAWRAARAGGVGMPVAEAVRLITTEAGAPT